MSVSWNPWHGCRKISEGCRNCYVYRQDSRHDKDSKTSEWSGEYLVEVPLNITAVANEGYEFAGWTGDTELCKDALTSGTVNYKSEALVVEPDKEVIELHAKFRKVE